MIRSSKPTPPSANARWVIFCDGATRGSNPSSEGGYGFAVFCDDLLYYAQHGTLTGTITSVSAELGGIYHASNWAFLRFMRQFTIITDSRTAVSLVSGEGNPKREHTICETARCRHFQQFADIDYRTLPREHEHQRFADFLSNLGLHSTRSYRTLEQHAALLDAYDAWKK